MHVDVENTLLVGLGLEVSGASVQLISLFLLSTFGKVDLFTATCKGHARGHSEMIIWGITDATNGKLPSLSRIVYLQKPPSSAL